MTYEEMLHVGLPKWPQCRIWGKRISEDQALEIIRRTDTFFSEGQAGNNHRFNRAASKITKRVLWFDHDNGYEYRDDKDAKEKKKKFAEQWKPVSTDYIQNSWVSCPWVGGPHGWCHPDGTIGYCNNIGKYPEPEYIYNDLVKIAKEFQFVEFFCCVMNDEECSENLETRLSFLVKDGKVKILDPIPVEQTIEVGVGFNVNTLTFRMFQMEESDYGGCGENYFTLNQIEKWAKQVWGDEYGKETN